MRCAIQPVRSEFDKTITCNKAAETKIDPGLMQSIEQHWEIPKGEAAVKTAGELRKRRKICNLAAERQQKKKERPGEVVDPGGSWLLSAGRYSSMQK
jgi:hypothetical protein